MEMTCRESRELLLEQDHGPAQIQPDSARWLDLGRHLESCSQCSGIAALLRTGARSLALDLASSSSSVAPSIAALTAYQTLRRRRLINWIVVPALVLVAVVVVTLVMTILSPDLDRLLSPSPRIVTQTFSLKCLSPAQAAGLIRPYLDPSRYPRLQAESFEVRPAEAGINAITVRAPEEILALIPQVLDRFEVDGKAACRRR